MRCILLWRLHCGARVGLLKDDYTKTRDGNAFCVVIVRWVITLFSLSDKCSSSYFLLLYSTYEAFGMGYGGWTFRPAVC